MHSPSPSRAFEFKWGSLAPAVSVRQEYEHLAGDDHTEATLAGIPGTAFESSLDSPAQNRTRCGLAVTALTAHGVSVALRYEFATGRNLDEHTGAVSLDVPF